MNIDYEKLENIVILFWDNEANFNLPRTQAKIGKLFEYVHLITDLESFKVAIDHYNDQQEFLCFVHLSHSQDNQGYYDFLNSKIQRDYPNLRYYLITSALKNKVYEQMESLDVYTYDKYQEKVFSVFIPQTKGEIVGKTKKSDSRKLLEKAPQIDYVVITALEEKEMEKMLLFIENEGSIDNRMHLIEYGHLKHKPQKKVAYASQLSTGMIDAAVLSTELIYLFKPKFLIMAGVLGGKPNEVAIGDVVIATKVFTIDKGKLTEDGFQRESEQSPTDNAYVSKIKRKKKDIIHFISTSDATRDKSPDIHFGPIACVRLVVDLEGYFNSEIESVDRKSTGLEMESYGVSRACELANGGKTIPLIIKSVMDNTTGKTDDAKSYAAWTSAMVVNYILSNDVI